MPGDPGHSEGARLICIALQYAAPILAQVVNLVHSLRDHPNPRVRKIAREKLPLPQQLDCHGLNCPHKPK